jgi:acylphosphatase
MPLEIATGGFQRVSRNSQMLLYAIVKGRVQGVGFRYWVLSHAQRLGLTGWVRNLRDGRVELEAQGSEDQLFEFEQLLWKGPTLSRVEDVDCKYSEGTKNYERFSISH